MATGPSGAGGECRRSRPDRPGGRRLCSQRSDDLAVSIRIISQYNYSAPNAQVSVLSNNGEGTFALTIGYPLDSNIPDGLVSGDFSGNGYLDLAVLTNNSVISVLMGMATERFSSRLITLSRLPLRWHCGGQYRFERTRPVRGCGRLQR